MKSKLRLHVSKEYPHKRFSYTNSEASALAARMTTPPNNARGNLIDTLIGSLKSGATSASNIWAKLDGLYILAAADSQAGFLNWKANQYNATEDVAGTFTADRGWQGNGTTSVLNTNFTPSTATTPQYALNSAHFGLWSRTAASVAGINDFPSDTNATIQCWNGTTAKARVNAASASSGSTGVTDGTGHFVGSRSVSTTQIGYHNATQFASGGIVSVAVPTAALKTGATSARQFAALHWGAGLSAAEDADLYNALNTYLVAVGAA